MSKEADVETGELIAEAVAAAIEAGWNKEAFEDVVETLWPDIQRMFAKHIVEEALAKAMR